MNVILPEKKLIKRLLPEVMVDIKQESQSNFLILTWIKRKFHRFKIHMIAILQMNSFKFTLLVFELTIILRINIKEYFISMNRKNYLSVRTNFFQDDVSGIEVQGKFIGWSFTVIAYNWNFRFELYIFFW